MMTANVKQTRASTAWRAKQAAHQRGASRVSSKRAMANSIDSLLDYGKIALWLVLSTALTIALYQVTNRVIAYINQPIAKVTIFGDLGYVDQRSLQQRLEPLVSGGFISIDLESLRQTLENTPWISHVEVERVWPNELKIHLNGKHPIARWGDNSLLNNVGESFKTKNISVYQSLPLLDGPDYAQSQVMQQYQIISQLLRPMEYAITSLSLDERGSWALTTNTGLKLILGNDDLVEKVRRFARAYEANLKGKIANIASVDLRYSNGLAVAWKDPSKEMATNPSKMVASQ